MQKRDWDKWLAKSNVKPWQAILLSLDRNPAGVPGDDIDWPWYQIEIDGNWKHAIPLPTEFDDDDFRHRMLALMDELRSGYCFDPVFFNSKKFPARIRPDELPLGAFVAWCELSKFGTPSALAGCGKSYGGVQRLEDEGKKRRDIAHADWWAVLLNADYWWNLDSVTADDAAMLLCGHDPNNTSNENAEAITTRDDTAPDGRERNVTEDDYKNLRRAFKAKAHTSQDRKLSYWLALAQEKKLRYHGWIDLWLKAQGIATAPAESKPQSQTPAERRKNHDINKERGCKRLLLEHWDEIERLHGPHADGRQARNHILKQFDASERKPILKTVQNHLAKLRSNGLIP